MAISKLFNLEETYQRMGSRIEKFLIIQVHSNSNLNIKTCCDYYVAPIPSDLFKLYSHCTQNQSCGELNIMMTQGMKVDRDVTNPWGGFSSLTFVPGPQHRPDIITYLLYNQNQATDTPKLKDYEPGSRMRSWQLRKIGKHLLSTVISTLQTVSLALTPFLISAALEDQYCY